MLMPVQLPDDFVIARALEIQIRNQPEIVRTGCPAALVIVPPVDLRTSFNFLSEQRKPVLQDLIGQPLDFHRKRAAEQFFQRRDPAQAALPAASVSAAAADEPAATGWQTPAATGRLVPADFARYRPVCAKKPVLPDRGTRAPA